MTHAEWEQRRFPTRFDWPALEDRNRRGIRAGGTALAAALLDGAVRAGVRVLTGARLVQVRLDQAERVAAAVLSGGETIRVSAVILATGGFDRDEELRTQYLPEPATATGASPANTGDALRIAAAIGARLDNTGGATPSRRPGPALRSPAGSCGQGRSGIWPPPPGSINAGSRTRSRSGTRMSVRGLTGCSGGGAPPMSATWAIRAPVPAPISALSSRRRTTRSGCCAGPSAPRAARSPIRTAACSPRDAVPGMYAAGNAAAFWTADGYPGPGATLGIAMTIGYLAGRHAARLPATPPG